MRNHVIPAILLSLLSACSTPRIALPLEEWKQQEELPVKGRQGLMIGQKLSFGEYRTHSVRRSWTKGTDQFAGWAWGRPGYEDYSRIAGVQYSERKQTVRFTLGDDRTHESHGICISRTQSKHFVIGNNPNSLFQIGLDLLGVGGSADNLFWVKLYMKHDEKPWEMILDNEAAQRNSKTYTGIIARSREEYLTLHPVYKLQGKDGSARNILLGSVGYEIRDRRGKPLAAVSLIDRGMVYLNEKDPQQRILLASICTALLLQEAISS